MSRYQFTQEHLHHLRAVKAQGGTLADAAKEIRRIIDRDLDAELLQSSRSGKWYTIKDGEFKPVEG